MTSKQRAYLKGLAMSLDSVFQIGKASLTPEVTEAVRETFHTRELVKLAVLKNCMDDPRQLAEMLAERTGAQVVQVIGKKSFFTRKIKTTRKLNFQDRSRHGGRKKKKNRYSGRNFQSDPLWTFAAGSTGP